MAADKNLFENMTKVVIDKLEGGYYHPNMLKDGRIKDSRYASSGETMFGIDRKAGGSINDTTAGKAFWSLIDNANAANSWKWNYKGGTLSEPLKSKAADVMYPEYEKNSKLYLSPESKAIVDKDSRLLFHFIYGTWNGAGWFKKFATDINKAVASGIKNSDDLVKVAIESRTKEGLKEGSSPNSLIKQGGEKIASFINSLKDSSIDFVKKKPLTVALITAAVLVSIYVLVRTIKKK